MKNRISKSAFTLAEILIAVAIIGVLVAITIPIVRKAYQDKVFDTSHKKMKGEIMSVLEEMNSKKQLSTQTNSATMASALSNHLKTKKVCTSTNLADCFTGFKSGADNIALADIPFPTGYSNTKAGLELRNGPTILLSYATSSCASPYMYTNDDTELLKCVAIYYDTNGFKKPNELGKDVWLLNDEF